MKIDSYGKSAISGGAGTAYSVGERVILYLNQLEFAKFVIAADSDDEHKSLMEKEGALRIAIEVASKNAIGNSRTKQAVKKLAESLDGAEKQIGILQLELELDAILLKKAQSALRILRSINNA